MQNYDILSLNEQQLNALYQTEGAVLVTAGAGSGKTRLLTHRIAYLIKEKGVSPHNILAITFTNKAANEMAERTGAMLDCFVAPWISTFHSMCARILRKDIDKLGFSKNFSIYSDADTDKLIDQILIEKGYDKEKKDLKKACSYHISNCKNNNMSIGEYANNYKELEDIEKIIEVFNAYEKRLFASSALDFNDLLIKTYELLNQKPEVLNYYTNRFRYILVDEFQDTNTIQYELVKLLANAHKNVFVVGDEDQCIYTWRGASYRNISRFISEFEAKVFKLEINYRSTPNILNKANALIANNAFRIEKNLQAVKEEGFEPEYYKAYDEQEEANYIVNKIMFLSREKGFKYSDFAILMRVNSLSLAFEQMLLSYNIPYRIFGGFKFFERAEVRLVLAYLKLFANPQDEIAFLRVINAPKRGLGDGAISKLRDLSNNLRKSLLETCFELENNDFSASMKTKFLSFATIYQNLEKQRQVLSLGEFAHSVVEQFEIKSMYDPKIDEELFKQMNIETLLSNIDEFAEKNADATLEQYLESVTLISDIDAMDDSNQVTIATIHAVKGLEFKAVFVVGVEEGIFPIFRALNSSRELEEERRLMYVALTRAEERLYLTSTSTRFRFGKRDFSLESRFLKELDFSSPLSSKVNERFGNYSSKSSGTGFTSQKVQGLGFENLKSSVKAQGETQKKDISSFKVGQSVLHTRFGTGEIISINNGDAEIKFETFGQKTLILALAPLDILE